MKLVNIELKKYFKHPSTYIIAALLILVMLISIMIYKPTLATDTSIKLLYENYDVNTTSYSEVYNWFMNNNADLTKSHFDTRLDSCNSYLLSQDPDNNNNNIYIKLENILNNIDTELNKEKANLNTISGLINQFHNTYKDNIQTQSENYSAVITKEAKSCFEKNIADAKEIFNAGINDSLKIEKLKDGAIASNLRTGLKGFKSFLPTKEDFLEAKSYYDKGFAIIESLRVEISGLDENNGDVNSLLDLIEEYALVNDSVYYIVTNSLKVSAIYKIGENEVSNYIGLDKINTYEFKELVVKEKYLLDYFKQNKNNLEYIGPINITYTDVQNVNIADYVGFVLTLCSFVIIVYISIMGAISVNSEFNSGTMRMIATKPYKKSKIMSAKIWSTIIYGLIILLATFIVSIIMGGIAYGFTTPPVLIVLNATIAFVCNVYIELILFLLTLVIQLILFASLAVLISVLIKNKIIAATVSSLLYFASIVLNIVNINISFLPFANINLWKYFGGSFLNFARKNFISKLFLSTPIATNTIIINIISFVLVIVIAQIISYVVFKKKEVR